MKPILEYLYNRKGAIGAIGAIKKETATQKAYDEIKKNWKCKYIDCDDALLYVEKIISKIGVDPKIILKEIGQFSDPDDLWKAYDRGDLDQFCYFMEKLKNTIKYHHINDEMIDYVYDCSYEIMEYLIHKNGKN